ncbi:alcohol oxidase [Wilcoxina mikolae CBS 423.85]|nr:alcohol oxidase [Wilcoxina mikolae CBS 423.85]
MYYRSLLALILQLAFTNAAPFPGTVVERQEDLRPCYDYVVVGGGTSGLVVADRLSEDPKKSVLVIEAGILIPDDQEEVLIPGLIGTTGLKYDWAVRTQKIPGLNNNTFYVPSAKVVGGGTAINGMFFDRGSKRDYDSWEKLGNKGWNWEGLEPYFKKSETYHPPDPELGIEYDPATHGSSGPVQVSYPPFMYPQLKTVMHAMKSFGINIPRDGGNGEAIGAFWVPNSLDPKTETRSYAKTAYYALSAPRKNYHLITQHQVTKILIDNKIATGVIFSSNASSPPQQVLAKAEVILAAGALHTPKLLQLSGIGPKALLQSHNIPVIQDLPGVGSNFQDHPVLSLPYNVTLPSSINPSKLTLNTTYRAEMLTLYHKNHTGPFTLSAGNTASFLPLPLIAPETYKSLLASAKESQPYLPPATHPDVLAGFNKQKQILLDAIATHDMAVDEFLVGAGLVPTIALQKPLSRGYVKISSSSPWDAPIVQHNTLSHPLDLSMLLASIDYAKRFMNSAGMAEFHPISTLDTQDLEAWVRNNTAPSFAHPSCTCPMMKRELGGVVDAELKVYSVRRLRIVDASVFPIVPSTHLSSSVYAVAEKAAEVIKVA